MVMDSWPWRTMSVGTAINRLLLLLLQGIEPNKENPLATTYSNIIMSSIPKTAILLLLSLFTFSSITIPSQAGPDGWIAVYWGQNNGDGSLTSTCDTGNYKIVILSFLNVFGGGRTPAWNFAGHCDNGAITPCTALEPEIKHCQENGVEVMLAIGGAVGDYSLCSPEDANEVAHYLFDNFLSGEKYGPLGRVSLDGIVFDIEGGSPLYWDDLVRDLDALKQEAPHKYYLGAAPQCPIPDYFLHKAIMTGLFDDLFVQFYNNPPCQHANGNSNLLLSSWDRWTSLVPSNPYVFLGLPAAPSAAFSGGYIEPSLLVKDVLPQIKKAANYGGVALWDRYRDVQTGYGDQIKDHVKKSALRSVTEISEALYECVSTTLNRILPKPLPKVVRNDGF